MKYFFICLFLFCVPIVTQAAIIINEVAWRGDNGDTSNEWIELYNDGSSSVDLGGWSIQRTQLDEHEYDKEIIIGVDSKNPTGSFILEAGAYAVLEKTNNDSAPGTAFFVYSGTFSLLDGGQVLTLVTDTGSVTDVLNSGENWSSTGGVLDIYQTAQYTAGGWIVAVSTPGYVNASVHDSSSEETEDVVETEDDSSAEESSSVSTLYTTPRTLRLSVNVPSRVYVHQAVSMDVTPSGLAPAILSSLTHEWNFGDFTVGGGEEAVHRFEYPGEYVVTLHSQYKDYEAYARKTITVLPVSFSLTTNAQGDVQVHNDARYEVDVSGYKIAAGKTLQFPEGTILLPNATITIPKEKLKYVHNATLFDDTATQVASIVPVHSPEREVVVFEDVSLRSAPVAYVPVTEPINVSPSGFAFAGDEEEPMLAVVDAQSEVISTGQMAAPIEAAGEVPDGKLPYFALLAVIGLGVTAVFAGKVRD